MIRVAFRPDFLLKHEKENARAIVKTKFPRRM
jgi:hypothetical protein